MVMSTRRWAAKNESLFLVWFDQNEWMEKFAIALINGNSRTQCEVGREVGRERVGKWIFYDFSF